MTRTLLRVGSYAMFALLGSNAALAGDKFVLTVSPSKVMRFNERTGALIDPNYCDLDGLLGLGGAWHDMREGVFLPNGELLVGNGTLRAIHRFSADGSTHLGDIDVTAQPPSWMAVANGRLWVIEGQARLAQYDLSTYALLNVAQLPQGTHDILLHNGELLSTAAGTGPILRIDPATGIVLGTFATPPGINGPITALASGNLLVGRWYFPGPGIHELTPAGALVGTADLNFASPEGIAELGNGRYLIASYQGIRSWDPATQSSSLLLAASGTGVFDGPASLGTNYCAASVNSTGRTGVLIGTGSDVVLTNDFHLEASALPSSSFGYLLTSRMQGFLQNPGGSMGNLCLGGSIGRFLQQIQSTGPAGSFSIRADLTAFPSPAANIAVTAGESWHFQAWHRDSVSGVATSNFTVGLEVLFR